MVDGSPIRRGTGTAATARPPLACFTSVSASPQPFWANTRGVYVSRMSPSPGSVNRVSDAVVPCVPYAVAGVVP